MAEVVRKLAGQFLGRRPPVYLARCKCGREYRTADWAGRIRARRTCNGCRVSGFPAWASDKGRATQKRMRGAAHAR